VSEYQFLESAPPGWESFCQRSNAVFGSAAWQKILASSFGARTLYAWNGQSGGAITVFKAGPFSVGYLGFPAGSIAFERGLPAAIVSQLEESRRLYGLTCIRIPVSEFADNEDLGINFVSNPETAITALQQWDLMGVSKNLRRDLRKAGKSDVVVRQTTDTSLGPLFYDIYESTVKHHGGSLRYNCNYFSAVLGLAAENSAVQCFIAELADEVIGFAVVVNHGDAAFYLHGGATLASRKLSPSDLILAQAITQARSNGLSLFNCMASPPDQPTLVRYKEKWGAETRTIKTYTVPVSNAYWLFNLAERLRRFVS
jgi:hypothetical protein